MFRFFNSPSFNSHIKPIIPFKTGLFFMTIFNFISKTVARYTYGVDQENISYLISYNLGYFYNMDSYLVNQCNFSPTHLTSLDYLQIDSLSCSHLMNQSNALVNVSVGSGENSSQFFMGCLNHLVDIMCEQYWDSLNNRYSSRWGLGEMVLLVIGVLGLSLICLGFNVYKQRSVLCEPKDEEEIDEKKANSLFTFS